MACPSAHLPDSAIALSPVNAHILNQRIQKAPEGSLQHIIIDAVPVTLVRMPVPVNIDSLYYFSKNVELLLNGCFTADAHRIRIAVAAQVDEFTLKQVALSTNAIHCLEIFAVLIATLQEPAHERVRLLGETQRIERIERQNSIAQPGVAIIPVACSRNLLRQGCCWRGHKCARRSVEQHLEGKCAPPHPFAIFALVCTSRNPVAPAAQRMRQFGVEIAPRQLLHDQPARLLEVGTRANREDQSLPLMQRDLHAEGRRGLLLLVQDTQRERRQKVRSYNRQGNMLLPIGNHRSHMIGCQEYFARRG